MSSPIKSDALEIVSGGAANPKIVSGTADPTAGFSGAEGSVYLRYGVGTGKIYVKTGALATDWGQAVLAGGGAGTLDQAYDFGGAGAGRTITADSGSVQINATTGDVQAALTVSRIPGSAAAAVGIDLVLGANFNASGVGLQIADAGAGTSIKVNKSNSGSAVQANLSNVGAKALEVVVTAAPTSVSPVSIVANTTGTTADLLSISKIPGAATAGNALSVSMGANTSGSGIYVSQAGTGPAIEVAAGAIQVANSAAAVSPASTGRIRYDSGTQKFQVSLNGAAYVDIATGAGFTLDIGDAIGSSTVGSVLFVGAGNVLQQDNSKFFWDNTNKWLGIGTATPAGPVDIRTPAATVVDGVSIYNTAGGGGDGRATMLFRSDVVSSQQYTVGIDPIGGTLKYWAIRDITGGGQRFILFPSGNINIGSTGTDPGVKLRVEGTATVTNLNWTSGTTGSVWFTGASGALAQDNTNFFWDNTNKRLGIGTTAAPAFPLDVKGLLGNTAAKFGDQYPIALVSGTNFVVWSSVGFSSYYNGGWRFADMTAGTYGAYMTFDNSAATWSFYRSNANFTGSGSLWGTPALHMTMGDNLFRLPYLAGGGSNRAGLVFADPTGKLGIDVAGDELWWDTLNKRIVMGGIPAWAAATIDIRKGFSAQIHTRDTSGLSATSGSAIRVGVETNPSGANLRIGAFNFGSYLVDIITPTAGAAIEAFSEAAWTAGTSHPTYLSFKTAASGSASPVERMRFPSDGSFQMPGSTAAVSAASTGRLRYNSTGQKFEVSYNGAAYVDMATGSGMAIGNSITSATAGSVLYASVGGVLQQSNASFFWDASNSRLGVGTAVPLLSLDVRTIIAGSAVIRVMNTAATGRSFIEFADSLSTASHSIGHGNANIALTHLADQGVLYSNTGQDWVVADATAVALTMHPVAGSAGVSLANGSGLAVSAASQGRLRYNTTGQKFQVSANGGAYTDLATGGGTGMVIGNAITSATAGSVLFAGVAGILAQNNAVLFWDNTNERLGLGTITPAARLHVKGAEASSTAARVEHSSTSGYAGVEFINSGGAFEAMVGYGNAAVGIAHLQTNDFLYSTGPDWVIADATRNEFTFGMGDGFSSLQIANGSSAAVSAASTGRIRYNTTGQKFQISANGGAYVDIQTGAEFTLDIGDAIGSSTVGSVLFAGAGSALAQDNANLFWDDTNNRLGIGNAAPAEALHVTGTGRFSAGVVLDTLTAGSILFAGASGALAQDNTNLFWDDANNRLGVGTATPSIALDLATGTAEAGIQFRIGTTLPVSAASTGRIRYNATGQVFQISKNTAAYEDMASLATAQTFTKSQNVLAVALTDAANIATDASLGNTFTVTLGGNRTLDNPTNLVAGGVYRWAVTQDGTGSRTLAYGTLFKWPGGTAPTLTTAAGAIDSITAIYDGAVLLANFSLNYS